MKTLVELYDDRPLENILAVDVFRPETVVYLCHEDLHPTRKQQEQIRKFLKIRGTGTKAVFLSSNAFSTESMAQLLKKVCREYPDCVLDITGGTDAALFASGLFCGNTDIPVFTYSRKRQRFFDIRNAEFAQSTETAIHYRVKDFFMMAGGAMREGRVDNEILSSYFERIDAFFAVYMKYRNRWTSMVSWFQKASQWERQDENLLTVRSLYKVKSDRGGFISPCEELLRDLEEIGFLCNLLIDHDAGITFTFADLNVRNWLRDVGAVLELYIYKHCFDCGAYSDIYTSAVVDWEGEKQSMNVTNEIDVAASAGVYPIFISCKACEVKTEALNELAILRDRFGGEMARAAIATTHICGQATKMRAEELRISVIDLEDFRTGNIDGRLRSLTTKK